MAGDAELVKAGIDAALAPVKDFANRLFGPAFDELGGILADPIRIYRFQTIRSASGENQAHLRRNWL